MVRRNGRREWFGSRGPEMIIGGATLGVLSFVARKLVVGASALLAIHQGGGVAIDAWPTIHLAAAMVLPLILHNVKVG